MDITLNGEQKTLTTDMTDVQRLLTSLNLEPQTLVVELNHRILAPDEYATTSLNDGDIIELVHFVGGG